MDDDLEVEKEFKVDQELKPEVRELLNPGNTAMLVIDIQQGYCDPEGNSAKELLSGMSRIEEMIPKLNEFIEFARSMGMPVIWTRMIEDPELSAPSIKMKMQSAGYPAITTPGTPSFEYFKVAPVEGDVEIVKKNYDAFLEPDLDKILKEKGISTVVVTGVNTGVCVDATIRSAQSRDYYVFVPHDLVGEPDTMKERGRKTLETTDLIFGWVTEAEQIREAWKEGLKPK